MWLENQTLKSHDSADTRGKTYRILILPAFSVGEKRKNKKDGRALVLWGKGGMRQVWLSSSVTYLVFFLKSVLFLEIFENSEEYEKQNLKTNFIPQI